MKCMWDLYWFSTTWLDPIIICFEGSSSDLRCCQPQRWDQGEGEGVMALKGNFKKQWCLRSGVVLWKITFIFELVAGYLLSGREDPNSEGNPVLIALLILCTQPEDNLVIYSSAFRLYRPDCSFKGLFRKDLSLSLSVTLCFNGPAACLWKQ